MKPTKFQKFLINRNLLKKFEFNLKNNSDFCPHKTIQSLERNMVECDLIKGAFSWVYTPENGRFWYDIDRQWRACLTYNEL